MFFIYIIWATTKKISTNIYREVTLIYRQRLLKKRENVFYKKRFSDRCKVKKNRFLFSSVLFLMENIKKYVFEGCHQGYLYVSKMLLLPQITVLTSICAPPTLTKMAKNMIKNTIFSSKLYMVIRNILEMLEKRFHWEKSFF